MIPEDDSVRLLSHELEDLDYTLYSSRKIERACRRDIDFMWLLAGSRAPDHSTIARFRTGYLAKACEDLFYQWVGKLAAIGELSKETVFIDGTRLEACANKYTFVWRKSVGKWEEKMFVRVAEVLACLTMNIEPIFVCRKKSCTEELGGIVGFLESYCREHGVIFVSGRGKRKSVHQRYYEAFRRFLDRQLLYDFITAGSKEETATQRLIPMLHLCT